MLRTNRRRCTWVPKISTKRSVTASEAKVHMAVAKVEPYRWSKYRRAGWAQTRVAQQEQTDSHAWDTRTRSWTQLKQAERSGDLKLADNSRSDSSTISLTAPLYQSTTAKVCWSRRLKPIQKTTRRPSTTPLPRPVVQPRWNKQKHAHNLWGQYAVSHYPPLQEISSL